MSPAPEKTSIAEIKKLLSKKDLFIFDLDGTLFNTLGDLAPAVNYALKHFGIAEISKEKVRSCIGNGSRNLIRRAVASGIMFEKGHAGHLDVRDNNAVAAILERKGFDEAKIDDVLDVYSQYYWEHCTENTEPYEGVLEFINRICESENPGKGASQTAGIPTGSKIAAMLTNKPVNPAKKILEKYGLIDRADNDENADCTGNAGKADCAGSTDERGSTEGKISIYLCGDTSPERKPSPAGIFKLLADAGVTPEKAVMIGDDTPDVMAAKNAGIDCITLLEGFGRPENLLSLSPKYTAGHVKDLVKAI